MCTNTLFSVILVLLGVNCLCCKHRDRSRRPKSDARRPIFRIDCGNIRVMRLLLVLLAACSGSSQPSTTQPASHPVTPDAAPGATTEVMTKEACEAQGGRMAASIGGGDQPHCASGETELGPVRF